MHPREEIAHDLPEIREDLTFEREVLDESIRHDYSTSDTGIVPLNRRRPMWHFMGLWTTFVAGFSYMFLGFEIHDGGHSLASTVGITIFGYALYVAYAMVGSYLGSRTGQTHALLTRSVFGLGGDLPVHRPLFAVRRVLARVDHRDGQPVRDQRRQLLRIRQRGPEPDRRLA